LFAARPTGIVAASDLGQLSHPTRQMSAATDFAGLGKAEVIRVVRCEDAERAERN
jgi:hypothetical protein